MLLYTSTKSGFMKDMDDDVVTEMIQEEFHKCSIGTSDPEIRSWKNSMQYMYKVLNDSLIPSDSGIAIEFKIPATDRRIDFTITGYDNERKNSVIIIELKQWENCQVVEGKDGLVSANEDFRVKTFVGKREREVEHPSYKAYTYAHLIKDFNESVEKENIDLYPCAYLHNYKIWPNDPLLNKQYKEYLKEAPVFGSGDIIKLRNFIKEYVKYGDNKEILFLIDNGRIRPSKSLQNCIAKMLKGNKEFLMI